MGFHMLPRYAKGHISATGDQIHFKFGSRVGFSGSVDRMSLFLVTSNPKWQPAAILENFEWPYLRSATAHSIHLYSAHRAVISAIAELSCISDVRSPHAHPWNWNTETVSPCWKKYANEAETVSVFYCSFISPCATDFNQCLDAFINIIHTGIEK